MTSTYISYQPCIMSDLGFQLSRIGAFLTLRVVCRHNLYLQTLPYFHTYSLALWYFSGVNLQSPNVHFAGHATNYERGFFGLVLRGLEPLRTFLNLASKIPTVRLLCVYMIWPRLSISMLSLRPLCIWFSSI